jgi:endonuclease G, mitochondrial
MVHIPRPVAIGIAVAAGAVVGGTGAYWWLQERQGSLQKPLLHPALRFGAPTTSYTRTFETFVVEYDPRMRVPRWVLEHFNASSMKGDGTRSSSRFVEDGAIPERFRASLEMFRGSGYDRGHMAPAANHKSSQKAMDDTFVLSNIAPQVGEGFNRDYWARFERFVQDLAYNNCEDVFVVTGPLFLPRPGPTGWRMEHSMLGNPPQLMGLPTHFYKVMVAEGKPSSPGTVVGAFVMPNARVDPSTPLSSFAVPLSALEAVAGVEFFPNLLRDEHRVAVDEASLMWQQYGCEMKPHLRLTDPLSSQTLLPPLPSAANATAIQKREAMRDRQIARPGAMRNGFRHVCEHNACTLPAERWWESNSKKVKAKDLRRTQSSPDLQPSPAGR